MSAGAGGDSGWLTTILTAVVSGGLVQTINSLIGWRKSAADANLSNAEAVKAAKEGDAALEAFLNERVKSLIDGLRGELERQGRDCLERERRMAAQIEQLMQQGEAAKREIIELRQELDRRPRPSGAEPIGI